LNKRQLSALETKEKLLESAEKLITEKGFANVSVEDITKDCKVAKGSFYVYFKKKEDIITEIGYRSFKNLKDDIDKMTDKDILYKLRYYIVNFMQNIEQSGIEICRQWTKNVLNPKDVCAEQTKLEFDILTLKSILSSNVENGELCENTPVDELTYLINSQLYGMMTCWCMSDGSFEPTKHTNLFCDIQLEAILKQYIK
jgi:AcrR family transcriptional regulator